MDRSTLAPNARKTTGTYNSFSGTNTLEVFNKGIDEMKDLQVGDLVQSTNSKMVHVYGFGPYQPDAKAEFLQISAKGFSKPLEISKGHLVFVTGHAVPASTVQVGDKLDTSTQSGAADVVKIKKDVRTGVFTPFTTSGTILVSGVAASSYVTCHCGFCSFVGGGMDGVLHRVGLSWRKWHGARCRWSGACSHARWWCLA